MLIKGLIRSTHQSEPSLSGWSVDSYFALITPNNPFAYPFGPAAKKS